MLNAIYDFMPESRFNPFIGAGVGINHTSVDLVGQFSNVVTPLTAANPAIQNGMTGAACKVDRRTRRSGGRHD